MRRVSSDETYSYTQLLVLGLPFAWYLGIYGRSLDETSQYYPVTAGKDTKKETKLGLSAKKASDFGDWYSQVVVESEMISYYDVSGAGNTLSGRCLMQEKLDQLLTQS